MTKDEARVTKEARNPNDEADHRNRVPASTSAFNIHSSFSPQLMALRQTCHGEPLPAHGSAPLSGTYRRMGTKKSRPPGYSLSRGAAGDSGAKLLSSHRFGE